VSVQTSSGGYSRYVQLFGGTGASAGNSTYSEAGTRKLARTIGGFYSTDIILATVAFTTTSSLPIEVASQVICTGCARQKNSPVVRKAFRLWWTSTKVRGSITGHRLHQLLLLWSSSESKATTIGSTIVDLKSFFVACCRVSSAKWSKACWN
jgi:hypothetical protein